MKTTKEKLEVKLTNQTFNEAGGSAEFPDLDIGGIVMAHTWNHEQSDATILKGAYAELKKEARQLGYTHIFGVKQEPYTADKHPSYGKDYRVVGTGYKPRKK